MNKKTNSFIDHLSELRSRIIKIILFISGAFVISFFFSESILDIISHPIRSYLTATEGRLIFITPFEKFSAYLWISLFSGIALSCPLWFYQVWQFISPGLYREEKKWSLFFAGISSFLFLSGILFFYFVVYPLSFHFLLNFGGENEVPYISLKPYLSFFLRTAFIFGLVFELPLLLIGLLKFKIITTEQLANARPYVLVFIALLSAIITPPDIFSMLFMMLPLYLLFEASLWIGQKFLK